MKIRRVFFCFIICISLFGQAYAAIIDGDWKREMVDGLGLMAIEFKHESLLLDKMSTVYSGPGTQYHILAENVESRFYGIAGAVGNWVLVNTDYGIGYVYVEDLPTVKDVRPLRFPYALAVEAPYDCCMIKQPYQYDRHSAGYSAIIRKGTPIIPLAEYCDCLYVECCVEGVLMRGFIPPEDYRFAEWKPLLAEAGYYVGRKVDLIELYTEQYAKYKRNSVASGIGYTVGLKSDGTCVAKGKNDRGQCDVQDWKDIIAVSASYNHTVGLRSDGTVVAVGDNTYGQCEVQNWGGIVAISTGARHTVGLTAEGVVVVAGDNTLFQHALNAWRDEDIVEISAGAYFTIGLTSDGRVLNAGWYYSSAYAYFLKTSDSGNYHGIGLDTSTWRNITSVSAGPYHVVGLQADGTVVGDGESCGGQLDLIGSFWDVSIVVATREGIIGVNQEKTEDWKDVQFMDASPTIITGVRSDGTIISYHQYISDTFNNEQYEQYDLSDWTDIGLHLDSEVFIDFTEEDIIRMYL